MITTAAIFANDTRSIPPSAVNLKFISDLQSYGEDPSRFTLARD